MTTKIRSARSSRSTRSPRWPVCLLPVLCLLASSSACGAEDAAGRWEGVADIPGAPLRLVIDLAPEPGRGWIGSVTLPGRGVKGAALDDVAVTDTSLRFGLAAAFSIPADPPPQARLGWRADGSLAGELRQGGHSAALTLRRSGPPQVDRALPGTAISPALEGTWVGRYELGGYPRDVTLTLANRAQGTAAGELVIVGKRTSTLAVDHVVQGSEFISLQARAAGFRIEGRWATPDGTIQGQMAQGPFEAALVLRRKPAASTGTVEKAQ